MDKKKVKDMLQNRRNKKKENNFPDMIRVDKIYLEAKLSRVSKVNKKKKKRTSSTISKSIASWKTRGQRTRGTERNV